MTRMIMEDPLPDDVSGAPKLREAMLSEEGLQHISRLVTLGELAMCFSHELKDPLTALIGSAHLMGQRFPKDDPMRMLIDTVARNGLRIKGMAQSMLDFGRRRDKTAEACGTEELIREAVRFVEPYFESFCAPSIAVDINTEFGCPRVLVDRWQMIHVFVNLLNNAADAMSDTRERAIAVHARPEAENIVRISVADTGAGIAPDDAGKVFSPFFTTKGEHGNGLGLYIARRIVEEHGGTIAFETHAAGTVFTICLPAQ